MKYIFPRFPNGLSKAATFSYDDAVRQDIRLAALLDKHGLKGSFNIYTAIFEREIPNRMTLDEIREHILEKGHEVALHGHNHIGSGSAHPINCIRESLTSREFLEKSFGRIIRGMAYPDNGVSRFSNGNNYETVKNSLRSLGIVYARTLRGDNNSFELPDDWYAWMPTAHHNNPKLSEWVDEFISLDVEREYVSRRYPRLLKIWGHSSEFDINNNWDIIERICERLGDRNDIWFATSIEIYEYMRAYDSLVFSADSSIVYNPTVTAVWFYIDGKIYKVDAGKTIKIED